MLSKEDLRLIGNLLDEKFDEKLTPIRDDIRVLKEDVAVLKEDVTVLKKDVRVLKKDVRNLKKEVTVLKKDVVTLKEGMVHLDNGIRDLRLDTIRIEGKLDEYYYPWLPLYRHRFVS